ncbi:ABC-2 type transport system ATP-binding protein [Nonlabens xylanidelens]|uniref:ABC-2 type transport system ATP-binding protein n=1 Tax=Nonlabens xylanidelens TaxID=191564 RepID=A0A2S6IQT6_9FLAO|nr:ABC transporter ATP-binding protein [Nonlabens xylanidelens]PPK96609.1 ABC-2 type transport system ATP-binding protein [Nonlabens xylanidelens]PQJ13328.1 ABC transporter ATP-binding protein [Nonlabens xylanidelens]
MSLYLQRLEEVKSFFDNKDTVLGYRKLMDCAMDTQDMDVYKKMIALTDWKEQHVNNETGLISRSMEVLSLLQTKKVEPASTQGPVITASDITKTYGRSGFQLGPVSIDIKKGHIYGLVGENGNGKTTLLRILARELNNTSGSLNYVFKEDIASDYDLRAKLVYIPQRTATWYGSLKDNLKFVLSNYGVAPEENETRVLMMIARLGLWNYKQLKWSELSSGYKMRFELARTLLRKPEVMLLDEPLANLDVLAQQVVLEDLKSICNSVVNPIALILSSQQLYEVEKVSDKVIYLKNGQYTDNNASFKGETLDQLIIEIDSTSDREAIKKAFENLPIEKLVYNGGVYLAYFAGDTQFYRVLYALGAAQIEVTYIRNISSSTRRFFVS